ncbi:hypothetical protein SAMN05421504_102813 [Amycolatopsis xylanica]|uniref:Pentapeptide repeat-containing protein n=1 Tax=Amycolatopsis xylanica TaxID=589385 RepID=A0A1H3A7A6_9PSEU|nr:hypothetical protein [Amycolatopsis xylanica]SDX25331.1 hypothetical protein SAMN05421504_102813 [Amycolatopsis xylanica]
MGRHSLRKARYLPKVAAGAAPLAFVLAGQAAWAADLPIEHRHSGSLDRGLTQGSTDRPGENSSFLTGFLTAKSTDVITGKLPDGNTITAGTTNAGHADSSLKRREEWSLDPANAVAGVLSETDAHLATETEREDGVRLPNGVDLLSQHSEAPELHLTRTNLISAQGAHALSDLGATAGFTRSSGQAADLGDLGAVGTSSEQFAHGSFTGLLDLSQTGGTVTNGFDGAFNQAHAVGGHLGGLSTSIAGAQSGKLGYFGAFKGTLPGVVEGSETALGNSFNGDLGLEHVAAINANTATDLTGAAAVSQPLTGGPSTQQNAKIAQELGGSIGVLDQTPLAGGLRITGLPLEIQPQ